MDCEQKAIIKNNLIEIKSKIDKCQSLSDAFNSIENHSYASSDMNSINCSVETGIVKLYSDLLSYCKNRNIV